MVQSAAPLIRPTREHPIESKDALPATARTLRRTWKTTAWPNESNMPCVRPATEPCVPSRSP
jgi:hypothetical protein